MNSDERSTRETADPGGEPASLDDRIADQQALLDELQAAQKQLVQSEKLAAVGQLAAGIAHEINNPLGYVTANLNQLREYLASLGTFVAEVAEQLEHRDDDHASRSLRTRMDELDIPYILGDIPDLVDETNEGLVRVIKIIADLKSFSRQDDAVAEPADLHEIIESTINVCWNELKYRVTLEREFGDVPPVTCHTNQVGQVIMNLLVNAGQAIDDHGTITVRTGAEDGIAWIEVADTGRGIAADRLEAIFAPFYTTKPAGKGTGLGLSVSHGIVEKHGGTLTVASVEGEGSTFRVELPVEGPERSATAADTGDLVTA
ncbi:hypothetical protein GF314_06790 [bacterium]|jgi:signal transduction histidine kinase|nr:hypothetical protein [bacterium]